MSTFTNNNVASGDVVRASDHNTQGANIASVVNGNIEADNLATNAVTTAKIADANVTTAKIADGAVTSDKLSATVAFRGRFTAAQNITTGFGKILFAVEDYDYGSDYASSRFTAPKDGLYNFSSRFHISGAGATSLIISLYKNGAEIARGQDNRFSFGSGTGVTLSTDIALVADDYIEVFGQANGTIALDAGASTNYFTGRLVG